MVRLVFRLEFVLFLQLLCGWRYKYEYVSMSRICDVSRAADHVVSSVFCILQANKKWSRGRPGKEASFNESRKYAALI